jgi:hypothetical protein
MTLCEHPVPGSLDPSDVETHPGAHSSKTTDDPDAPATGTWLSVPPGTARAEHASIEASASSLTSQTVVRRVVRYGAIGLGVGFFVAGSTYAISSWTGRRASNRASVDGASHPAAAARKRSEPPPTEPSPSRVGARTSDLPATPGSGELYQGSAPLAVLHAIVTRPYDGRPVARGHSRRSNGIPTAKYPDIALSDDPAAIALLAGEVARLKRARRALERGDAPAVLIELEAYRTTVSNHVLANEALALGAEALLLQNRRSEAAQIAGLVLSRHPESELGARMSVIAGMQ